MTTADAAGARSERVNVMEYAGKDHMLRVVRGEMGAFFALMDSLDDQQWLAQTPCSEWQVRDLVGHMVDVTEASLERWAIARAGGKAPDGVGLRVMASSLDKDARRFREVPRADLLARLKHSSAGLFEVFDRLDENQWAGELVTHVYMGPLPAFFYPAFQLMDYGVHGWDARMGLGRRAPLPEDAAGTLIPFMFILMQSTVDADSAKDLSLTCGVRVSGPYGGTWRLNVADGALSYAEGPIDDCDIRFSFDANDFVLTAFQRIEGGVAEGSPALVERFRRLFFKI